MNCLERIVFQVKTVLAKFSNRKGKQRNNVYSQITFCLHFLVFPDQLMYLPPTGTIPVNQEDPDVPLKKILLWNGASSWGGLKPGRGIFLKEKCPMSTCVLSSARGEAESADLVLFKDHFTMPYFKCPTNQIWMLYLLGSVEYFDRTSI